MHWKMFESFASFIRSGLQACESCNYFLNLCNIYSAKDDDLQVMKNIKSRPETVSSNGNQKIDAELEKLKVHIVVEIIEYVPHAVLSKTIIKKTTGNITVSSFALGEELAEKTSPFDNYIQIIDGSAEVIINDRKYKLNLGEGIIIPAHAPHCFNANEQF